MSTTSSSYTYTPSSPASSTTTVINLTMPYDRDDDIFMLDFASSPSPLSSSPAPPPMYSSTPSSLRNFNLYYYSPTILHAPRMGFVPLPDDDDDAPPPPYEYDEEEMEEEGIAELVPYTPPSPSSVTATSLAGVVSLATRSRSSSPQYSRTKRSSLSSKKMTNYPYSPSSAVSSSSHGYSSCWDSQAVDNISDRQELTPPPSPPRMGSKRSQQQQQQQALTTTAATDLTNAGAPGSYTYAPCRHYVPLPQ